MDRNNPIESLFFFFLSFRTWRIFGRNGRTDCGVESGGGGESGEDEKGVEGSEDAEMRRCGNA